jgi:hypothetical protein
VPNDSLAARLNGKLYRVFIAVILLYAVLTSFGPMMNQVDLGWQVAQGRWIVQHAAPYSHDLFNYPNLHGPVINEYPLFEIALYAAWSLGWWGPCLLTALVYAALIVVIVLGARRVQLPESALTAEAIGIMLIYLQVAFPLRPHVATYLGVTILGTFLLAHRDTTRWTEFWPVALLQIVWTNCHSGFVLGPAMAGLFGAEVTLRRWVGDKAFPRTTALTWLGIFALILLACFVNPSGVERFYPPIFQDRLESIRAYVGEMEPLTGGAATLISYLTIGAAILVLAAIILHRGGVSFAFLFLALFTWTQALEIKKAWPVFGLFVPLIVLSSAAFAPRPRASGSIAGVAVLFGATALAALAVIGRLNPNLDSSLVRQWHEYDCGHTELPVDAVAWMKANHISGRIFNRCEDGGILQQEGYDHGETFADTGFGKYDEGFIHEVGLVNERPALIPRFLYAYRPDFIVCGNFCYQWHYYLRTNGWRLIFDSYESPNYLHSTGWRLIFYTPNSSVWTKPEWAQPKIRPDLPTVTDDEIKTAFERDLAANGMPNPTLLGRNIIGMNSLGLENFAYEKLTSLPEEEHRKPWYWEAARIMCFSEPHMSAPHRDAFMVEAESLPCAATAEFRAYALSEAGEIDRALQILQAIRPNELTNTEAETLLKIELERSDISALTLARRTDCWDLRNGRHWQYLAEAEERWGSLDAARAAWKKAVFYYPDDDALMKAAGEFAAKHNDSELAQEIADSGNIYGAP